ncbi:translocation/assembly module TamB domain-containing protein [Thermocrinis minervae]|uniref:Translocation and assembly module TamB n=1 Tax=Thermocrinis minervae TaxID=381751 RepID=A0A1M6Q7C0_9AQUI|nr:translocation/assembly module TamB domain-containing protein [Thermocrinis minervae]SHK16091.1 translocation and assembly module TamB [Thermocrinis minervae]
MKYVGYFLLLILFLYFTLVKPYTIARGIDYEVTGLELNLRELKLGIKTFYIYFPYKDGVWFVGIEGLTWNRGVIRVRDTSVVEVSSVTAQKPFDFDFSQLIRLSKSLKVYADKVYFSSTSIPYKESITVFVGRSSLEKGKLKSHEWTDVYYTKEGQVHHYMVFVYNSHAEGGTFFVDRAYLVGDGFYAQLKAKWEGKKGNFEGNVTVTGYEGRYFTLSPVLLYIKGDISYTYIKAYLEGFADMLTVRSTSFKGLRAEGQYSWKWHKENKLIGEIKTEVSKALVYYDLQQELLKADLQKIPIQEANLSAIADGSIEWYIRRKFLHLKAFSDVITYKDLKLLGSQLELILDYSRGPSASVKFLSISPNATFSGNFYSGYLQGKLTLVDYPLKEQNFSSLVSYDGLLYYKDGKVALDGYGMLSQTSYESTSLGNFVYKLQLDGKNYHIELRSLGLEIFGSGNLEEKSFSGWASLKQYNLNYKESNLEALTGQLQIDYLNGLQSLKGNISGAFQKDKISSRFSLYVDIIDNHKGNYLLRLEDVKAYGLEFSGGTVKGTLQDGNVEGTYNLVEGLEGEFRYTKDGHLYAKGSYKGEVKGINLNLEYSLKQWRDSSSLVLSGFGKYANFSFPVKVRSDVQKESVGAIVEGFSTHVSPFLLEFKGLKVANSMVYFEGAYLKLQDRTVLTLSEGVWRLDIKNKKLEQEQGIKMTGVLNGGLKISYEDNLKIDSEGQANLQELFSMIRSRLPIYLEGRLSYTLTWGKDIKMLKVYSPGILTIRSRYLAIPLEGSLNLYYDGRLKGEGRFANGKALATLNFQGDEKKAHILMDIKKLPVLYRDKRIRYMGNLDANTQMNTDYKTLKIAGMLSFDGNLLIGKDKTPSQAQKPKEYERITLNLSLKSKDAIRINIPEGYVYANVDGEISGTLYEPSYKINLSLAGGQLNYFNKAFYVRFGKVELTEKATNLNVNLLTPMNEYDVIIDILGNANYPKISLRSDPPRNQREVLTSLVLGGTSGEGLFSLTGALLSYTPELESLLNTVNRAVGSGLKLNVSPKVGTSGETGVSVKVSKDVSERVGVEYQQSTLKDPKESFYGANLTLTPYSSVGGRVYPNDGKEVRVRFRKKFDLR